jgi:hypothetical protein
VKRALDLCSQLALFPQPKERLLVHPGSKYTKVSLCPYLFLADKVVPPLSIAKSPAETLQG